MVSPECHLQTLIYFETLSKESQFLMLIVGSIFFVQHEMTRGILDINLLERERWLALAIVTTPSILYVQ